MPKTENPAEQKYLLMLSNHVREELGEAFANFRSSPGGECWTRLEELMWAWQGISMGGLNQTDLLMIISEVPVTKWVSEIAKRHKD